MACIDASDSNGYMNSASATIDPSDIGHSKTHWLQSEKTLQICKIYRSSDLLLRTRESTSLFLETDATVYAHHFDKHYKLSNTLLNSICQGIKNIGRPVSIRVTLDERALYSAIVRENCSSNMTI